MRNAIKLLFINIIVLSFTSCSVMISDLKNCTKGSVYIVEHYQEIPAEYRKTETGYEQTNLVKDENDNLVPGYVLFETEKLHGEPESLTEALPKSYTGFSSQPFEQQSIETDGSTVIKIYYNRNDVTLTISIGDGMWNYLQKKQDDSIQEDNTNRIFTKKYGSLTASDIADLFASAGKKSCVLTKFILSDGSNISVLPDSFPANDETYTAVWEEGKPANYKVIHHFEKIECTDSTVESDENYEVNSDLTNIMQGVPEMETETQSCVASIPGFTAKPHSEQEISSAGSTVVNIFYVRNPYTITISTDEGLWNYDEWKADKSNVTQNTAPKSLNGKFGWTIDWTVLSSLKKTGMNLVSLKNDVTGESVKLEKLPDSIPAMSLSYTAQWNKKSDVPYEVKFLTEKADSTDSEDTNNYVVHSYDRSLSGTPEYFTEAVAKEIPGFTAKEIVQEEIKEDGTTVVKVYYVRNSYKITFDLNGGYWNYIDYRDDKSLTPDSVSKEINGKYESEITLPDCSKIGKRANNFLGWKVTGDSTLYSNDELSLKLEKYDSKNLIVQAQWEKGTGYEYTVRHWFEKADSKDNSNVSNYELNEDFTQIELGEEIGDFTEAVAKTVEGFTVKPFEQKSITGNKKETIDIFYTRNSSKFIFDANGGNISEGQNEYTGKYGLIFDSENTPKATKSGWTFGGWTYKGKLVTNTDLQIENQEFGIENKTFQAYWISTISVKTLSTFGDIVLTKQQDSKNITCSVTLPQGYESQNWSYKWYVDGVYTSDETVFTRTPEVLGKGVHTITLKATMNGQNFTQRVTATVE